MEFAEQHHVFGGFIVSFVAYWAIHQSLEYAFRALAPESYRRLNENRLSGLLAFMSMIMRGVLGTFVTVPSCVIAAQQTPWGYGQKLNIAGSICMISQAVPFVSELQLLLDTNTEVLMHHLVCLLLMGNIIAFPQMHMIKPFYLFFASQLGDISVVMYKCLKLLGWTTKDSWLVYLSKIACTLILVISKTGVAFYTASKVFKSPHRIMDWLWMFCMFFFGVYNLEGTGFNLIYLGVAKTLPKGGTAGLVFRNGTRITRFTMITVACMIGAAIVRTSVYGFLLGYKLSSKEQDWAWNNSIKLMAVIYMVIKSSLSILEQGWEEIRVSNEARVVTKKRELYHRIGALLPVFFMNPKILLGFEQGKDSRFNPIVMAASTSFTILLWDTGMRIAVYASVGEGGEGIEKDVEQPVENGTEQPVDTEKPMEGDNESPEQNGTNKPKDNGTEKDSKVRVQDFHDAGYQLRLIWANIIILAVGAALPLPVSATHKNYIMLSAHSLVQCLAEATMQPLPGDEESEPSEAMEILKLVAFILALAESFLAFASLSGHRSPSWGNPMWVAIFMGVFANISSRWIPIVQRKRVVSPREPLRRPPAALRWLSKMAKELSHPLVYTAPLISIMQIIELHLVWKGHDYTGPVQTSVGFRNLVKVMESPWAIIGGLTGLELGVLAFYYCT